MKVKSFKKRDYETLLKKATADDSTKYDRMLLLFWCQRYAEAEDYDGEGYRLDCSRRIYPVLEPIRDYDRDIIGNLIIDAVVL